MSVRITWWGHATTLVELGGVRLLTDPLLAGRLAHLRRHGSPAPPASVLDVDTVLVSHLHADHLHLPSLRAVPASARVLVPAGAGALTRGLAAEVREVRPDDEIATHGVQIRAVPAHHDGRRLPGSRHRGPALGYLLEHDGVRVWFAGDTGRFDAMRDLAPVDVAIVPVGGWGPTLGDEHLDPEQAAQVVELVGARHAVPVHYGTFWPVGLRQVAPGTFREKFSEPGTRFAHALTGRTPHVAAHVLAPGESVDIA